MNHADTIQHLSRVHRRAVYRVAFGKNLLDAKKDVQPYLVTMALNSLWGRNYSARDMADAVNCKHL